MTTTPDPASSPVSAACGYRWKDVFGDTEECGKHAGHGGEHLAHWRSTPENSDGST